MLHHQVIDHGDTHALHVFSIEVARENGVGKCLGLMFWCSPGTDDCFINLVQKFRRLCVHAYYSVTVASSSASLEISINTP